MTRSPATFASLLLLLIGAARCGSRQHLYSTAGAAKNLVFREQHEQINRNPEDKQPRPLSALDAEIQLQNYQTAFTRRSGSVFTGSPSSPGSASDRLGALDPDRATLPNLGGSIQLQAK